MNLTRGLFFYTILSFSLFGCNHFEYSPDQIFDRNSFKDINAKNLSLLGDGKDDDSIRFVLSGDTQRSRDETVKFCEKVNSLPRVDFTILAGDISEFGVLKEMEWISRALRSLKTPYVAVIGNHDLVSRGRDVFINMFGDLNYTFVYGGIKFVCHDTNGREYNFNGQVPDISWLKEQLKPQSGVTGHVAVSHVPANSEDFDAKLAKDYTNAFAATPGFLASLHAHTHNYSIFYPDDSGIPYVVTSAMQKKEFILVEIVKNKISFERVYF